MHLRNMLKLQVRVFFGAFFVSVCALWLWAVFAPASSAEDTFVTEARRIVARCASEAYRPACYDEEIPTLMDNGYSMEEAFVVTRHVQDIDTEYKYCHVLGHYLSAKETAKDPAKWKDVITRAPRGMCSNGAIHGAFQERFRTEHLSDTEIKEFIPELIGICKSRVGWRPTRLEEATCTHALGHLTMYVTGGNLDASVNLCDAALADEIPGIRQLCYDGVFMQLFQPLEPDDFALIAGQEVEHAEEARQLCNRYDSVVRTSCVGESWPLYETQLRDPVHADALCAQLSASSTQVARCQNGVFYVMASSFNLDADRMEQYCSEVSQTLRPQCFANTASRLIEVDWENIHDAVFMCARAETYQVGDACYSELLKYSTYNFTPGSDAFYNLCSALPRAWGERCLLQIAS